MLKIIRLFNVVCYDFMLVRRKLVKPSHNEIGLDL